MMAMSGLSAWTAHAQGRWEQDIAAFEAADRVTPPPKGEVVFVGSSTIRIWDLAASFPDVKAINRGFGGSEMADSTRYVDRIVVPYAPRVVVVYAGDNDIMGTTSEQIAIAFEQFVRAVHAKLPATLMTFRAGLQDAYMRVMNGYAADKFVEGMEKDIRDWAQAAKPAELADLANLLRGLAKEMTGKTPRSPEYLTQVRYNDKDKKLSWEKGRANFGKEKDLEDLAAYLNQKAQSAAAGPKK